MPSEVPTGSSNCTPTHRPGPRLEISPTNWMMPRLPALPCTEQDCPCRSHSSTRGGSGSTTSSFGGEIAAGFFRGSAPSPHGGAGSAPPCLVRSPTSALRSNRTSSGYETQDAFCVLVCGQCGFHDISSRSFVRARLSPPSGDGGSGESRFDDDLRQTSMPSHGRHSAYLLLRCYGYLHVADVC